MNNDDEFVDIELACKRRAAELMEEMPRGDDSALFLEARNKLAADLVHRPKLACGRI